MAKKIKTIEKNKLTINPKLDYDFVYQKVLTDKLDKINTNFNQAVINEIVLWKVDRYSQFDNDLIKLLNQIPKTGKKINTNLKTKVLIKLLNTSGVGLPMASTILKFKNRHVFQIIDQRVYRILYGKPLKVSTSLSEKMINKTINLYFDYLEKLRQICKLMKLKFEDSDRVLYMMDKRVNSSIKIR
jgi:hypothetical protein